ncbi:phosphoglucosamine mutase [Natronosalvus halobius]|uniref:phosphoglucosamine mutase n=1 Tax=Natronosalvus halobius TaxID=2953746 RepID=UPI00209CDC40|nr:phosphoglucosamine mutase [Natronosalvus halobius]USZ70617.1 phosphoglucosamine mutase [Natronosalvus halobius]
MFGTSGIRGAVGEEVTAELALSVGRAVASEDYERVVLGRDARESGRVLGRALEAGLRECGADVVDLGLAATPTVARAVGTLEADAGVVITASHNPATDNGIKLWTPSGKAFGPDQRDAISARIERGDYDLAGWDGHGTVRAYQDATADHADAIQDAVSLETPLSIVLDLGNGAGRVTADVLADLGCTVTTLNGQPDGSFPGRPSEPNEETLETLLETVAATDADLGIAHDGDADRMVAVDETGRFVPKDVLLALFAREAAGEGDRVAAPVDTSLTVDDALADVGATLTKTPVGDVYVAERATDADVVFGGEPSGAWIWPAETLCPDGPLAAAKLVELVAESGPLSALVDSVDTYPIRRDSLEVDQKGAVMDAVGESVLERYDDVDTLDGVRVDRGDGWFLLRASGTQPLIRVTAEARSADRADELRAEAIELLEARRAP